MFSFFPDNISSMGVLQRGMDNRDDDNVRRVAHLVVDDELEAGDVDKSKSFFF